MNTNRGRMPPYSGFKAAWRELVAALGGGAVVERAKITRVGDSLFSRYGGIHEDTFAPVDVVHDLEKAVVEAGGEPAFLHAYAASLGYVVVRQQAIDNPVSVLDTAAVRAIGAVGNLASAFYEAAKDGVITPQEAASLATVGRKAGAEVHEFTAAAQARAAKGGTR